MNKHTNPFVTFTEAIEVLKSLGADPMAPTSTEGATYPFPWGHTEKDKDVDWREHIINITVGKNMELSGDYYKFLIHLTSEGFETVLKLIGGDYPIKREICFADYDMFTVEPSPLLELYKLELREPEEETPCDCGIPN